MILITMEPITIFSDEKDIYYHVADDIFRYLDLESIEHSHPELKDYIHNRRFILQRDFERAKEMYSDE